MKQLKQFSIRRYVAWLTLAPLLVLTVGMETYFLQERFAMMDENLLDRGNLITDQLAANSEFGVFSNNTLFLQNVANAALHEIDVRGVVIFNSNGRILHSTGNFSPDFKNEIMEVNTKRAELAFAGDIKSVALRSAKHEGQNLWLYHAVIPTQIALDETDAQAAVKPSGYVIVEISKSRIEDIKSRMLLASMLVTTLFMMLGLYLVHIASRRITEPISELSEAVKKIGEGKLDTRVSLASNVHELLILGQGLNITTEQLQNEQAILQQRVDEATQFLREKKEEAERASQDKSRFLAVASHDLRQPLHAIGLFVSELQRKLSGTKQQHLIGQVAQSVELFSELLNALLDISKLDAGVIIPQMRTFDMNTMLRRIADDFQKVADDKQIRLFVRPCHASIVSDPLLLERILINLLSNAIRYTNPNGSVMLACRRRGEFLRIEVRDNGSGISKADQANIFREFIQLNQPKLDASKGLGLGLAIVDRLAKLLGHRIELRSALGEGSTFALEAPLAQRAGRPGTDIVAQTLPEPSPEVRPMAGKRLLVVDDDALILAGTANLLASWGFEVSAASSLEQVAHLMNNGERWDFIVSDYQLEHNTNGIEVITRVRQHQNQPTPCILITGDTSPEVLKLAAVHGYNLLYKPIKPARLRSLIMHLLAEQGSADKN